MAKINKLYKSAGKKIPVPEELLEKTEISIKHAKGIGKMPHPPRYMRLAVSAACVCIAFFAWFIWFSHSPNFIITELEAGSHVKMVELADGYLDFYDSRLILGSPALTYNENSLIRGRPLAVGVGNGTYWARFTLDGVSVSMESGEDMSQDDFIRLLLKIFT